MASAAQSIEFREARADLVRAALVVLDAFLTSQAGERALGSKRSQICNLSLYDHEPELYSALLELERAKARVRLYALPDELVRP